MNRQGWICARCNASLSPDVQRCTCDASASPSLTPSIQPYIVPYVVPYIVPTYPYDPGPRWEITCTSGSTSYPAIEGAHA